MQIFKHIFIGFFIVMSQTAAMENKDEQLYKAAESGDAAKVKELLEQGANPNAKTSNGDRPLNIAAQNEHIDVVKELLAHNADPDAKDQYNETPVERAYYNYRIQRLLVESGADPNGFVNRKTEERLLHRAVIRNDKDFVALLLGKGADPDDQDKSKNTALHIAVIHQASPEIIALLLAKNADPNIRDANGQTPIQIARKDLAEISKRIHGPESWQYETYIEVIKMLDVASAKFLGARLQPSTPPTQPAASVPAPEPISVKPSVSLSKPLPMPALELEDTLNELVRALGDLHQAITA